MSSVQPGGGDLGGGGVNPGGGDIGGGSVQPGGRPIGLQPRRKHHKPVTHHHARKGKGPGHDGPPDTDDKKTGKKPKAAAKPKVIAPTLTTRGLTGTAQALGLTQGYGDSGASGDLTGTSGPGGIGHAHSDAVYGTGQSYAPEYFYTPMPQEQAAQAAIASPFGSKSPTGSTG